MSKDTEIVEGVIRKGYQDATTSLLDRIVSEDIVEALRAAGWATPDEVRAIVAAAGGRVEIPFRIAVDPPKTLTRWRDVATDSTILVTSDDAGVAQNTERTVCIAHGAFTPCGEIGEHRTSANPFWVKSVIDFQTSTIEGLTWEPAWERATR